jgi:hypothetical protein
MKDHKNADMIESKRVLWNKGRMIGAKPPFRPKHVWAIPTKLQIEGRIRDLAMFNLAIDSKLRGRCRLCLMWTWPMETAAMKFATPLPIDASLDELSTTLAA